MEKKAKIKSTEFKKEWQGKNGMFYYHNIKLDNGDEGEIGWKEKMPVELRIGADLTYTIESSAYGNKIKAVSEKPAYAGGGARKGPDPKVQLAGFAMAYTKDLIVGGKLDIKDLASSFERIHKLMSDKL